jgi:hypothetical protein
MSETGKLNNYILNLIWHFTMNNARDLAFGASK